jgi:hypothetical protein
MSIELSDIDVIAGERSPPGRWTVRRDGELDVSERRPRLMGEGVHAMQWQGPVERAVGEAPVVEVLVAVRAVLRLRSAGLDSDLRQQYKWSSYSR